MLFQKKRILKLINLAKTINKIVTPNKPVAFVIFNLNK